MITPTGPGFTEPIIIMGEPWRYMLVPERLLQEVYALASATTDVPSDPLLREIADLVDRRRSTTDFTERNRLSSRIYYRRRKLRDREEL